MRVVWSEGGVHSLWLMVYGSWLMVYGLWFMAYGLWFMVYGSWFRVVVSFVLRLFSFLPDVFGRKVTASPESESSMITVWKSVFCTTVHLIVLLPGGKSTT